MKKRFLLAFIFFMVLVPVCYGREPTEITDILQDGKITRAGGPVFVRDNTTNLLTLDEPATLGYIEFNLTNQGIPANAIIDYVQLQIRTDNTIGPGGNVTLWSMTKQPSQLPDVNASNTQIWLDIGNGTYYNYFNSTNVPTTRTRTLTDAETEINITLGYFSIGIIAEPSGAGFVRYYSNQSTVPPVLIIKWHLATDTIYYFSGPVFENGNTTAPITVTAAIAAGNEEFVVNGSEIPYGFPVEPLIFYWALGGGDTRRIYSVGPENFTVTIPDDNFAIYTFTVRDFTNKLSKGDAYIEAWRIVNTTDTLIERMVIDVHNQVPLNLVTGATYSIVIRYYDNTTLDWGFFVSGQILTTTIILRGVEITDQAYLIGNFISVEIARPITTQITVDYLATRPTTIWSNVTVVIRNGALFTFRSNANESYTFNVGGLDADTGYTVLVEGEHTLQTEWAYSKTFDGEETYPDVPNIENIFPMGNLDGGNLIAWVFTLASGLTFSVIYRRASLLAMCAVGSFFATFGFADWNFYLLSLCWFFSTVVYLGSGDR